MADKNKDKPEPNPHAAKRFKKDVEAKAAYAMRNAKKKKK